MNLHNLETLLLAKHKNVKNEIWNNADIKGTDYCLYIPDTTNEKICLVAHIDTVHEEKNSCRKLYHDNRNGVLWNPTGLGADDRAGVYAMLEIYQTLPADKRPCLLFTDLEETGCLGAYEAADEKELINISYFIQLDRRNKKDAIFYNDEPKDFKRHITSHGFKEHMGTYSDISIICPSFGIAGVNLSVGYYNEHTKHEYLNYRQLHATIEKTKMICLEHTGKSFKIPIETASYNNYHFSDYSRYSEWLDWKDEEVIVREIPCDYCGAAIHIEHIDIYRNSCPDCGAVIDTERLYYTP
jgi:hypothetical protein